MKFPQVVKEIVRADRYTRILVRMEPKFRLLEERIAMFEDAFISTLERKPTRDQRKEAVLVAIKNMAAANNPGFDFMLGIYTHLKAKLRQYSALLTQIAAYRQRMIKELRINLKDDTVLKNATFSKKMDKCQVTVIYDGRSYTRHLKLEGGVWYGAPLTGQKEIGEKTYVVYTL